MAWIGLRHKGVEILYPFEWNKVVDALDILYYGLERTVKPEDLTALNEYLAPAKDDTLAVGLPDRAFKEVNAYYGYFKENVLVNGAPVLKDGDPVRVYEFIEEAKEEVDTLLGNTAPPEYLETYRLAVTSTPTPLSEVSKVVKAIHIKVPSWALYLLYLGNSTTQDFILEPKDILTLRQKDPSKVYVRSLGNVTVFIVLEE